MTVSRDVIEKVRLENLQARQAADPAEVPAAQPPAMAELLDRYVGMNKWETQRAKELDAMLQRGEIAGWWGGTFSGITLKLAPDCRYTPDFLVQEMDGSMRLEEVKGFWRDDALVKTKVCATTYPFPLFTLKLKKGGGWEIKSVRPEK